MGEIREFSTSIPPSSALYNPSVHSRTSNPQIQAVNYQRFQLLITADRSGGYTIQAITPKGQGEAHVEPPWPDIDASAISPFQRKPGTFRNLTLNSTEDPVPSPEILGEQLFKALFQGDLLGLYTASLDAAASAKTGLRIELTLNPQNPDLAAVQALPWELLRPPGTPDFLGLNPRTPITRFLMVPRPITAATRPQILRILAVRPLSLELPSLDLDKELRNLREAAGSAAQVIPVGPTLDALRQALRGPESHVLHFMGHGGAPEGQAENVLLFEEDDDGNPVPVTGSDLANVLAASPSLRLVVLNACDTASVREAGAGGEGFNPFTGVANALVLGGLPAVVGMQQPISDAAAITFSRIFYQQLAAGEPVDAAVTEGRRAMYVEDRDSLEWTTPVLFLRTPTGELYPKEDLWDRPPEKRRAWWFAAVLLALLLAGGVGLGLRNWRVERLVTEGAALLGQGNVAAARERFEAARRLAPGSAEILSNLAGVEERLGDLRAAEDHYREAVQKQPDSPEHLYNLGHFLNNRQSYDEAYRFLLQAVERDPQRADAHAELARAAAALGMLARARIHLETALRLDPESPVLYRRLGEIELDAGNPQSAILRLSEALRHYRLGDLGRVETKWLLARAYDRLGNTPSACREIQEIRRLDPPGITPWAQKAEEMLSRCTVRP
jgi:tetratricopeptide (TPR) repeat protein